MPIQAMTDFRTEPVAALFDRPPGCGAIRSIFFDRLDEIRPRAFLPWLDLRKSLHSRYLPLYLPEDDALIVNLSELMTIPGPADLTSSPMTAPGLTHAAKRLGIIVPYRDREAHLSQFLPHLISYFDRNPDPRLQVARIMIVEQSDKLPFNRGGLLNAGFLTVQDEVDYVCFHDVDYLPIHADYSHADTPTRIIWWGMHARPIRLNNPSFQTLAPKRGLGAVVLIPNQMFLNVNGFSNGFFGWGFEDKDLAARCGGKVGQRDGTFTALPHDNAGFESDGTKSSAWLENERRYAERQREYQAHGVMGDGLSTFVAHTGPVESIRIYGQNGHGHADVRHLSVGFESATAALSNHSGTLGLLRRLSVAVSRGQFSPSVG